MYQCVFRLFSAFLAAAVLALVSPQAYSADLAWSGNYRVEGIKINNSELDGKNSDKAYLLHHLTLTPRLAVADGLMIFTRFDLLNSLGVDRQTGVIENVSGDLIGSGPSGNTPQTSNAWSRSAQASDVAVTALYASWVQEFGQLVVGRAPLHFGLGLTYNSGNNLFDHYLTTIDMVGYKVVLGNLFIMPILGKVNEGNTGEEDDINDYTVHIQYENPETDLALGFLYQARVSTFAGNDTPLNGPIGGGDLGSTVAKVDGYRQTLFGVYSTQNVSDLKIAVEANFLSGDTGTTSGGNGVSINSFGIVGDISWLPAEGSLSGGLVLGVATGDDPGTADVYEGFHFNRNFDVAMLMFNHPLGQRDFLRNGLIRDTSTKASNQIDTEAVSNALFIAPNLQVKSSDKLFWGGRFIYGMLNRDKYVDASAVTSTSTNLGFELDLNVTYRPMERLTWVTELGLLQPGDAWKGGAAGLDNSFAYGITTKAAISF